MSQAEPAQSAAGPSGTVDRGAAARGARLAVVYRGRGATTDGIGSYSEHLTEALRGAGTDAFLLIARPDSPWTAEHQSLKLDRLTELAGRCDVLLLQYNPFSYGRWGVAPWLPAQLRRLRRRGGARVLVMVHEAFVAPLRHRHRLLRSLQRAQLRLILREADLAFCSTTSLLGVVEALERRVTVRHLPVGSNLPDRREERESARRGLGIEDDGIVVAAFGTNHPSRMMGSVSAAASAVARTGRPTTLLNLGAGVPEPRGVDRAVRLVTPGMLEEGALAAMLSAADVFVAPFTDGVSTRRTTLMAALQHGIAVVGTRGPNTDPVFERYPGAVLLVDGRSPNAFADAARRLADDADERRDRAAAGRRMFEEQFAWPVIGAQVAEVVGALLQRPAR